MRSFDEMCKAPGMKKRSKGKGRGLGKGEGKGPIGVPVGESIFDEMAGLNEVWDLGYEGPASWERTPTNLKSALKFIADFQLGNRVRWLDEPFENWTGKGKRLGADDGIRMGIKDLRTATANLTKALKIIEQEARKVGVKV